MKPICLLIAALSVLAFSPPSEAAQVLYLASQQDSRIDVYSVDPDSGKVAHREQVDLPGNPGPMALSPDEKFLYVALTSRKEKKNVAEVATLRRGPDGSLSLVRTASITSRAPYLRADRTGQCLLAAHYGDGEVTVYRIEDGICTGELTDRHQTDKTAHCIEVDPSNQFVFVPHTSPNVVYQFKLDPAAGKLVPNTPPTAAGPDEDHQYHQPRHYAHHPKLPMAYTSNERGGGISAWAFDAKTGTLQLQQTLSALPPGFDGPSAAADIRMTPDARFIYVSNRDLKTKHDTLAGFSIDPKTGLLKAIGHAPTVNFPRSFTIDTSGRFVYVAGQRANQLAAYRIQPKTGQLEELFRAETGRGPIWVTTASINK